MAKKISEKELNSVSGGCSSTYYDPSLSCFDYNDRFLGSENFDRCDSLDNARKVIYDKCAELFRSNSNIKFINWRIDTNGGVTKDNGTKYR